MYIKLKELRYVVHRKWVSIQFIAYTFVYVQQLLCIYLYKYTLLHLKNIKKTKFMQV